MRVLLVANPNSTSQSAEVMRQVFANLRMVEGARFEVRFTHGPGHAQQLVSGLRRSDYDAVVAVGGDGTVNEVVNGLLGAPVEGERSALDPTELPVLGVIPTGSANVFVRALGFSSEPALAAQALAATMIFDLRRTIRLGVWTTPALGNQPEFSRWFAVNAGFGLDADVLAAVDKQRARGRAATPLRYLLTTLRAWRRALAHPSSIDVTAHNGAQTLQVSGAPLVLASNTNPWTFLGPLPVVTNPRNSFNKGLGLFGLYQLRGMSGFAGLLHLFGAYSLAKGQVFSFDDAHDIELTVPRPYRFQADGELYNSYSCVTLRSVENALEVFAPFDLH